MRRSGHAPAAKLPQTLFSLNRKAYRPLKKSRRPTAQAGPMSRSMTGRASVDTGTTAPDAFDVILTAGTVVLTLDGALPVEHLAPGDRIVTRAGAQRLSGIAVAGTAEVPLVRISARALGHDRPSEDVILPASQPVLLRDWRARALFGQDQAVVPAGRLIDGSYIRAETGVALRLYRLTFERPAVLYAGDLELASTPARVPA
jgi:hypothetical protein